MNDEGELQICPSCGKAIAIDAHFCVHCYGPLTSHAATDPMGQIYSEGHLWRQAVEQSPKLIVVIGTWMFWGPTVLLAGFMLAVNLSEFFGGPPGNFGGHRPNLFEFALMVLIIFGFFGGVVYIGGAILYRTTRRFIESRKGGNHPPMPDDGDAFESTT